jgi:hypothetical protein
MARVEACEDPGAGLIAVGAILTGMGSEGGARMF